MVSTQTNQNGKVQDLSHASFKLEDDTPTNSERPSMSADLFCGGVDLTFNNPTRWPFYFDYRVNNEDGSDDAVTGMNIANGPFAGQPFGQIYNLTTVSAFDSVVKKLTFGEDTGEHLVAYRLWRGPENDWYLPWQEVVVNSDCESNIEPTPTPIPVKATDLKVTALSCENRNFDAKVYLTDGGEPVKDTKVKFVYNFLTKEAFTNAEGKAQVGFRYEGNMGLKVEPDNGFPTHNRGIAFPENEVCDDFEFGIGGGEFAEPTEMAETGVLADLLVKSLGALGGMLTLAGSALYAKKNA